MSAANIFLIVGGVLAVIAVVVGVILWKPYGGEILVADYTGAPTTTASDVSVSKGAGGGSTAPSASTVRYNGSTFSPRILIVSRGENIRFENTSNLTMRIEADRTSTTTQPNQYLEAQSVGKGGTYDLTFVDSGVWLVKNLNDRSSDNVAVVYVK
jgi:hypothetical protein